MTIHHDKLAYGRLKGLSEDMTEEQIADLLGALNADGEDGSVEAAAKTNADNADAENHRVGGGKK